MDAATIDIYAKLQHTKATVQQQVQTVQTTVRPMISADTPIEYNLRSGVVSLDAATKAEWDLAYAHIAESGASHTFIDQDVQTTASPTFVGATLSGLNVAGFVKNTAAGVLSGGNSVDISADTNLAGGTGITLTDDTLSTTDGEIVHDSLSGFVANEHIDWTNASAALDTSSTVDAGGGFKDNGVAGIDTTFVDADGNTITVSGGIITAKTAP